MVDEEPFRVFACFILSPHFYDDSFEIRIPDDFGELFTLVVVVLHLLPNCGVLICRFNVP
jgi:hypothetical protein